MATRSDVARIAAHCAALGLLAASPPADAGDWRFRPSVSASQTYTDNTDLAAPGAERHEFVTQVMPSFYLTGSGSRINLDLVYNVQALRRARVAELDLHQQLQATGNAELVKRIVFLDFTASRRQENTSDTGVVAADNLTASSNVNDVTTYTLSPFVRHRFGSWVDTLTRWTFDGVDNASGAGSSTASSFSLELSSGDNFTRLPWSVTVSRRKQEADSGATTEFQSVDASVQYQWTRKLTSTFSTGYEKNDFATSQSDETDSLTWSVGGIWTPTPRTSINTGLTKRFSGTSVYLDLEHRFRRAVLSIGFDEDTTTSSQLQLERQLVPLVDAFGDPILDPDTGQAATIPINTTTQSDEVIVLQRLDATLAFQGKRSSANVSAFDETRTFQLSGADERVSGVSLGVTRTLSGRTSVGADADWQVTEVKTAANDDVRWSAGMQLTHTISRSVSGTLSYRHAAAVSDTPANEFDENRVTLNVSVTF